MEKFQYKVCKDDEGYGIKWILKNRFSFSHRFRTKLKFGGHIKINGEIATGKYVAKAGDVVVIEFPKETSHFEPEDIPLDIVYEDEDLLVINKQAGIIVHPTKTYPCHTLANGIAKYIEDRSESFKLRFINRLDMNTTGLILVGKNSYAQSQLIKDMGANRITKNYIAFVAGSLPKDKLTIDLPIGNPYTERPTRAVMEDGQKSITHVEVLKTYNTVSGESFSKVGLKLETGRTHQIRVHLSHIGHPILGDELYGDDHFDLINRQALHACHLEFYHPVTKELIELDAPLPSDMARLEEILERLT